MHHTAAELTVRQRHLLVIPRNWKNLINVWSRCRPSFIIALLHAQLRRTRYCYSSHIRLSMGPSLVRLSCSGIVSKRLNESTSLLQTTLLPNTDYTVHRSDIDRQSAAGPIRH